ncbi:hypothetical protein [Piscinibacter sp.]|uniref:hypothetical protein n=1 Tax=Piscinibacter sp. TaxID=1903157 RepID=UPI002F410E9D
MKHAGPATLAALEPLLCRLRQRDALKEKTPGAFYLKSAAFLHFHEDVSGTFADVKLDDVNFTRLRATTADEQAGLLARIDAFLAPSKR